jgi:CrcB protein
MWRSVAAVAIGSIVGGLLRWTLSLNLNHRFTLLPPGTLVANLLGGYIVGLAVAYFAAAPDIAPEWRLLIITGFCGGLTTFSSFSAEVVLQLQQGRVGWAAATIAVHLGGSLLMTIAGIATWQGLHAR